MASAARWLDGATPSDLPMAVAQILGPDGTVVGAGFLVAENLLVTCAHVVRAAGSGPRGRVLVTFPRVTGADLLEGHVEQWRETEEEDVAFVRLPETPTGTWVLPLGSAEGCSGHEVRSFGFAAQAPQGGHLGKATVADLLKASPVGRERLQLTEAHDLTTGFSGAPVLDETTSLVIGMFSEITAPDQYERGQGIAYATPTQVLRGIVPALAEHEVCPYRGLEPFTAAHSRWFKGRDKAVEQVLANLAGERRLTLLLGPSGSGKSSLIQAGVLPALAEGRLRGSESWLPVLTRPRKDLLTEIERAGLPGARHDGLMAAADRRLASEPDRRRVLLVIDQFEELLVQSADGRLREFLAVIDEITTVADSDSELSVILVMRDDFYPQLAASAGSLLEAATPGLLNVPGTLGRKDLCDIIVEPAENVGLHFQQGLPEQIISDILEANPEAVISRQAPVTVLPLLEMTLTELWRQRKDGHLTHEAYQRIGAVGGSLTAWCEKALKELSPDQQDIAKNVLTSLVRPADTQRRIPPVRAQVPLDELRGLAAGAGSAPDDDVDAVIATLARRRIITTTQTLRDRDRPDAPPEPVAELIHDALIRDWGRLRKWVSEEHEFHEWLERTRERQLRWAKKRDPGDLLAGTALADSNRLSRGRGLPKDIADFLTASRQRQEAIAQRRRRLITVLAALLVLALLAGAVAFRQWRATVAEREAALSRQLAVESGTLINVNPELSSLLAVQAYRTSHTTEALSSLRTDAHLPLGRRLLGHTKAVNAVAFHGRTLASGSSDGTVRVWDTATGKTRTRLTGLYGEVNAVAFSPDGRTIATGSSYSAWLWDAAGGKARTPLTGHTDTVFSAVFSPDGRTVATASADGTARLWDATTGKPGSKLTGHTDTVFSAVFSPDGRTVATASADGTARLWDATTGKPGPKLTGHTAQVLSVAFSPDGRTIATGGGDGTMRLWDAVSGKPGPEVDVLTGTVLSVAFSPDGRTIAIAGTNRVTRLWDVATRAMSKSLIGHTDAVNAVAFSPDGRTLATGSDDTTARLWKVAASGDTSLVGHTDIVYSVAFSPDGDTVASSSGDKTAILWDVATGRKRLSLIGHKDVVLAVTFSPDGHTVATAGADGTARLWDATTGKPRLAPLSGTTSLHSVAFGPDGRLVTGGRDGTVQLWDADTGKPGKTLKGHTEAVFSAAFSSDGRTVATGSADKTVRLWDVTSGKAHTITTPDQVHDVTFSPDGRTLAIAVGDYTVRLWDVATRTTRTTLAGRIDVAASVAFSPDGRTVATGDSGWTTGLWDVTTGKNRMTLIGQHADEVTSVAFSPDGRVLASGSVDKTVHLWHVALPGPAEAIRTICRAAGRDLTKQERTAYLPGRSADPVCPSQA
ncbi:trypsin-like peptidase domain-containing protein [Streptomyces sp. NPDC059688]|uniref:nSTAND1 domain-containing NTPase n=1 Tax=Streptomyces sp. NPDC059688 TaxID=3346906 RepID=UPI0036CC15E1